MFKVTVEMDSNVLRFTFANLADALKFVGDCVETAEYLGTKVSVEEKNPSCCNSQDGNG